MHDWILRCRRIVDDLTGPPYLDAEHEWDSEEECTSLWRKEPHEYYEVAERLLSQQPSDLALRFALLYPIYQKETLSVAEHGEYGEYKNSFRHLVALCIPEEIADLRTL